MGFEVKLPTSQSPLFMFLVRMGKPTHPPKIFLANQVVRDISLTSNVGAVINFIKDCVNNPVQ